MGRIETAEAGGTLFNPSQDLGPLPARRTPDLAARRFWRGLILLAALIPLISSVLAPRVYSADYLDALTVNSPVAHLQGVLARPSMYLFIIVSLLAAWVGIARGPRLSQASLLLWLAAMSYSTSLIFSAMFGAHPHLSPRQLVLPALFTAVLLLPRVPLIWLLDEAKRVLLGYAYASILLIGLAPTFAMETKYDGILPLVGFRLHGIAQHANSLAPLMVLYLIMDNYRPARRRSRAVHLSVVYVVLLLTQSKTAWLVLGAVYLLRSGYRAYYAKGRRGVFAWTIMVVAFGGVVLLAAYEGLSILDDPAGANSSVSSLRTFTGRTNVWDYTLTVWRDNPWFGYGPDLWDRAMRLDFASRFGWAPGSSHNQWYQSLGQAGIVGVLGLILYACAFTWSALATAESTKWMTLEMLALMAAMSWSEISVPEVPFSTGFLIHFIVFGALALALGAGSQPSSGLATPAENRGLSKELRLQW